eukprot:TRINITY_DN6329_c0_g1_i1.p1 TRINITY_DN6329_c0_g1~~TRINITY_DN6329_c0_g1_i1.p1  ORF type:complete len:949 (-),score=154.11 TRINITY_DN6329_c0_g1_i1:262-3108(-)
MPACLPPSEGLWKQALCWSSCSRPGFGRRYAVMSCSLCRASVHVSRLTVLAFCTCFSMSAQPVNAHTEHFDAIGRNASLLFQEPADPSIAVQEGGLRRLAELSFGATGEDRVESFEEVIQGAYLIHAPIPMSLVGETILCLKRALASSLTSREDFIIIRVTGNTNAVYRGPDSTLWQTFQYEYSILSPRGASSSFTEVLTTIGEGSPLPTLIAKFQAELKRSSATAGIDFLDSNEWGVITTRPIVSEKEVLRPISFGTVSETGGSGGGEGGGGGGGGGGEGTSGSDGSSLSVPPVSTNTNEFVPSQSCSGVSSPCMCASRQNCEWIEAGVASRCQAGSYGVPCSMCNTQNHCAATQCSRLNSPCACAYAAIGCRWIEASGQCADGAGYTPCSACATQSHCDPPEVASIIPASGATLQLPAHLTIQVNFDRKVLLSGRGTVEFKCSDQPIPFNVPWSDIHGNALGDGILVSINILLRAGFTETRTCSLGIGAGVVRDAYGVPFIGLNTGAYTFKLGDTVEPQVVGYSPQNGKTEVLPGSPVTFVFNEDIVLLRKQSLITLYELVDGPGPVQGGAVAQFSFSSEQVLIEADHITVDLIGFVRSSSQYSLELPAGSLSDAAGNLFQGLPSGAYRFRTSAAVIQEQHPLAEQSDIDLTATYSIAIVVASVFLLIVVCVITFRMLRLQKIKGAHPVKVSAVRPAEPSKTGSGASAPQQDDMEDFADWSFYGGSSAGTDAELAQGARNWAQRVNQPQAQWQGAFMKSAASKKGLAGAAAAAASMNNLREGKDRRKSSSEASGAQNVKQQGTSSKEPATSPKSPTGRRSSSASAPPQQGDTSSQAKRSSTSGAKAAAGGPGGTANSSKPKPATGSKQAPPKEASADTSGDSPELKAKKHGIERKLRDMMSAPIADRKKALRELMLEYHPDKSSDPLAKEVFQFINSSRGWFLAET